MWRKLCVVVIVLFSIGLSGCTSDKRLIEPYSMTNEVRETMNNITDQGVYAINSSKAQLILYHGIEKGIKSLSYTIENNLLTVIFETEGIKQPRPYLYQISSNSMYDSIAVTVDGVNEAFVTVYLEK